MPTPDRFPGPREDEEIQLETQTTDPTVDGAIRYVSGNFKAKDDTGVFNLRSGSGLTEASHRTLDFLGHDLDENYYLEYTYTGNRVDNVTAYTDSGKTTKIREWANTWSIGRITQVVETQYDNSGVWSERLTYSIVYSGIKVSNITVVRTTNP